MGTAEGEQASRKFVSRGHRQPFVARVRHSVRLAPWASGSPPQGSDTSSSRFDHQQIPRELVHVRGDDCDHPVSLRYSRQAIQLQQDDALDFQPLANDQLTEIPVLRDQDAPVTSRRREHVTVQRARVHRAYGRHVEAGSPQPFNDMA